MMTGKGFISNEMDHERLLGETKMAMRGFLSIPRSRNANVSNENDIKQEKGKMSEEE